MLVTVVLLLMLSVLGDVIHREVCLVTVGGGVVVGVCGPYVWTVCVCCCVGVGVACVALGCIVCVSMAEKRPRTPVHRKSERTRCGGESAAGSRCLHLPSRGMCDGCVGWSGGYCRLGTVLVLVLELELVLVLSVFGDVLQGEVCLVIVPVGGGVVVGVCGQFGWAVCVCCCVMSDMGGMHGTAVFGCVCVREDDRETVGRPCALLVRGDTIQW